MLFALYYVISKAENYSWTQSFWIYECLFRTKIDILLSTIYVQIYNYRQQHKWIHFFKIEKFRTETYEKARVSFLDFCVSSECYWACESWLITQHFVLESCTALIAVHGSWISVLLLLLWGLQYIHKYDHVTNIQIGCGSYIMLYVPRSNRETSTSLFA